MPIPERSAGRETTWIQNGKTDDRLRSCDRCFTGYVPVPRRAAIAAIVVTRAIFPFIYLSDT